MKELSIEEKAKAYDEALSVAQETYTTQPMYRDWLAKMFPELKESEDEKIRKELICYFEKYPSIVIGTFNTKECITWLEKQSTPQVRTGLEWVNTIDDACDKRYSEEYAHGEYCHEQSFKWGFQEGVDWLEKQDNNPTPINIDKMVMEYSQTKDSDFGMPANCMIRAYRKGIIDVLNLSSGIEKQGGITKLSEEEQNRFAKGVLSNCAMSFIDYLDAHNCEGKMCVSNGDCADIENAFHNSMWDRLHRYYCKYIEKQDEQILANSTKACKDEQNPADKVEPKFKIKYASSEYNVLEVKDIAGVTYYGIEDEPNHIDYVQAENCERVDGYSIKESGSPFPTKPAKFSEQTSAWSEEDAEMAEGLNNCLDELKEENGWKYVYVKDKNVELTEIRNWLKALKDRMKPQRKWSKEDSRILYNVKAYIGYAAGQRGVKDDLFKEANKWLNSLPIGFTYNKKYNKDETGR